jgi:hypothetical protein
MTKVCSATFHRVSRSRAQLALAMILLVLVVTGCPNPVPAVPRPPGGDDGSARWAVAQAHPALMSCAADVEVRAILGARISMNGRLFTNVGTWSVVGWSPSQQQTCQVNVSFDGSTSTTTRAQAAPGPGIQRPMPLGENSTAIFADMSTRETSAQEATLVLFNESTFPGHPGQAVWAINASHNYWYSAAGAFLGN